MSLKQPKPDVISAKKHKAPDWSLAAVHEYQHTVSRQAYDKWNQQNPYELQKQ